MVLGTKIMKQQLEWKKEDKERELKLIEEEKAEQKERKEPVGNGGEWALKMPKDIVEGKGRFSAEDREAAIAAGKPDPLRKKQVKGE
jgi:hypothetical protein